ncbi:hypothetical protein [Anaerosporobacter sp.]|uniref:hypothetical protein n=1 Tax=Anaerosporobacter sp. TaxID=1872529 RepID=UPI00286F4947|nr:hypothetical protein [Anaerosporobacter sp.]
MDQTEKLEYEAFDGVPMLDNLNKTDLQSEFIQLDNDEKKEISDEDRLGEYELALEERAE